MGEEKKEEREEERREGREKGERGKEERKKGKRKKGKVKFKGAQSDCFRFFSNFQRFWYQKKGHIFLITLGKCYSWKMYCLEDINENVTSYGNYNFSGYGNHN